MAPSGAAQMTIDSFNTYLDVVEAHAPQRQRLLAPEMLLSEHDRQCPPTKDQVYYWRELAGAMTLRGTAGMSDDGWPVELSPTQATLTILVERQLIVRRRASWHLRRHWYARLSALRQIAVDAPTLSTVERPAPELPTYVELKDFETICRYLDIFPKSRARLPFSGLAIGTEGEIPAALRLMRRYRLVRHTGSCEWALSPTWRARLQQLWRGVNTALRDYSPPQLDPRLPHSLVAGIDTWHLNWLVEYPLPFSLRERLDSWQEEAREDETEIETDLLYDGAPLLMYRWGTKAEQGKRDAGVSWGYVLLNKSLRLLIRKSPLGGIIAQVRLGSECLWRRTPKSALDELTLLMKRLWHGQKGSWQVSQVHLCHDVTNVPLSVEMLSRFVSRSRQRAVYEAAQADMQCLTRALDGEEEVDDPLLGVVNWEAEFANDDPSSMFSTFSYGETFEDEGADGADWSISQGPAEAAIHENVPLEERASALYHYGKRLSGFTFSPGGAISFAIYLKRLESLLRRKVHMFPLWKASNWNEEDEVTRFEARLRRDALRGLRLPGVDRACLDDPYELLNHLESLFALIVGQLDACPDAVNTAWIRLAVPSENESNRSRWDTDPAWRVVQSASFTPAPVEARRIVRRKQRVHNLRHLVSGSYGYLASLIAEQFQEGEQWDVSRAIGELAQEWVKEAEKPGKDFGELVRLRRKERGLPVLLRTEMLPVLPIRLRQHSVPKPIPAPEAFPMPLEDECKQLTPLTRKLCAERRMRDALQTLEDAELRQEPEHKLVRYEAQYAQEEETYMAVCQLSVPQNIDESE
jgi:hypothetical protein